MITVDWFLRELNAPIMSLLSINSIFLFIVKRLLALVLLVTEAMESGLNLCRRTGARISCKAVLKPMILALPLACKFALYANFINSILMFSYVVSFLIITDPLDEHPSSALMVYLKYEYQQQQQQQHSGTRIKHEGRFCINNIECYIIAQALRSLCNSTLTNNLGIHMTAKIDLSSLCFCNTVNLRIVEDVLHVRIIGNLHALLA